MNKKELLEIYQNCIMSTYDRLPLIITKGKGSYLWDIDNKKYLDFFPGWGVSNLGHCHPKVMQAVRDQIGKLIFVANHYHHPAQAKLAKELTYQLGYAAKVFFCNSGAEANEAAIKLARCYGKGRYEIIVFENSFHGRTFGALSATAQKKYQEGFSPLLEGFRAVRFNDLEAVGAAINPKTVAVMLELIQGEGGVNVADKEFVVGLRRLCDQHNLLLIVDEVQTGIGRTGKLFCFQHYDIVPDIVTLAKALGGGLPIGAMLARREIADLFQPGMHASTFGGGPVVSRAALAVLKAIKKERILAHAQRMGEYLGLRLQELKEKYPQLIKEIRGKGLMWGIELTLPGKDIVLAAVRYGLLINCTHQRVLRLMPALNVTVGQINTAIGILKRVFSEIKIER